MNIDICYVSSDRCLVLSLLAVMCHCQISILIDQGTTLTLNCTKSGRYFIWDVTKEASDVLIVLSQDSVLKLPGASAKYAVSILYKLCLLNHQIG